VKVDHVLFLFLSLVPGFFCVVFDGLVFVGFVRNYFMLLVVLLSILFVFFLVLMRECILVKWYLKAEILCFMGWFEKKLMVVSVMVGLRTM
jgi:hypothetical protein